MSASSASGEPIGHQPEADHRADGKHRAERRAPPRASPLPRGIGRAAVRAMRGVDIGVVPHVERAGGAGADGDADQRGDGEHRMHRARRRDEPDQRGEHHEEHHPRLHQREIVGDVAAGIGFERFRLVTGYATSAMPHSLDCSAALPVSRRAIQCVPSLI